MALGFWGCRGFSSSVYRLAKQGSQERGRPSEWPNKTLCVCSNVFPSLWVPGKLCKNTSWLKTLPLLRLSALFLLLLSEIHLTNIPLVHTAHRNLGTERKLFSFILSFFYINSSLTLILLDHFSLSVPPGSCLFQSPFASLLPSLYFFRIWNSFLDVAISHTAAWCKDAWCGPNCGVEQDNLFEWGTAQVNSQGFCSSWTMGNLKLFL